jgi:hypothetical protein
LDQSDAAIAPRLPLLALGAAAALLLAAALAGRDLWFFSDDWNIYADYHAGGLLEPFNGHLSLVPAGIYLVLFHTVGVDSYLPYRLSGLIALAVLAFQLVRFAHSRLGDRGPDALARGAVVVALAVAAVLWNSAGTMNLLFPFLMNFSLPIAALVAIWWHLDRADGDDAPHALRHEVLASLWLCLALGTSGLGLMTLAAVAVELVVSRAPWRRIAVMAPGPVLWAVWYLGHRDANQISTDVAAVVAYSARMFLGATTSLAAGSTVLGVLLALATVAFFVVAAWRWRSLDARTLGALAAPATFIVFTAVTRLDIVPAIPPDELRYSWAVAAYLVLAAVVAARRTALFDVEVPRGAWLAVAAVALAVLSVGAVRLWGSMQDWNRQVAEARPGLSTVLFATEAVGAERIDPDVVIPLSYVPVTTGGYLSAAADVGSPIATATAEDLGGAVYNRQVADQLLVEQLGIRPEPSGIDGCSGAQTVTPDQDGSYTLQPGQRVFVADASGAGSPRVRLARFAPVDDAIELEPAGETFDLALPLDDPSVARLPGLDRLWPYRVTVDGGWALSVLLCAEADAG